MKHIQGPSTLAVATAIAVSVCLMAPTPLLAAKPVVGVCNVGSAYFPTVQSAVDTPTCDAINIPAGVFYENVTIFRNVTIRGAGPRFTTVHGNHVNHVFLVRDSPAGPSTVELKGMTITGGKAGPVDPNGGGITMRASTLTVKDCVVIGNEVSGRGGGISATRGLLTIKDSTVSGNTATWGGGVAAYAPRGDPTNVVTIVDSIIIDNFATEYGGGIFSATGPVPPDGGPPVAPGTLIVKDSVVTDNMADVDGGGIYTLNSALTLKDSIVLDNTPNNIGP